MKQATSAIFQAYLRLCVLSSVRIVDILRCYYKNLMEILGSLSILPRDHRCSVRKGKPGFHRFHQVTNQLHSKAIIMTIENKTCCMLCRTCHPCYLVGIRRTCRTDPTGTYEMPSSLEQNSNHIYPKHHGIHSREIVRMGIINGTILDVCHYKIR